MSARRRVARKKATARGKVSRMDLTGWKRLGREIVSARARRWRLRPDFAAAAGLSLRLLVDLETGARGNYLPATLAAVESALGWPPGACMDIVEGRAVRRDLDPRLVWLEDAWPQLSVDTQAVLIALAERALAAT